jgi:hypothetical protein
VGLDHLAPLAIRLEVNSRPAQPVPSPETLTVKPASPYPDRTLRSFSGVVIRTKTNVELLAEAIATHSDEGRIANWCVIELLPQLKQHHWDAYAKSVGIESPTPATIALAVELYKQRIGYVDPAPQQNPLSQFS